MSAVYTALSRAAGSFYKEAASLIPNWLVDHRKGDQSLSVGQSAAATEACDKSAAFAAKLSPSGGRSLPVSQAELSIPATNISNKDDDSKAQDSSSEEDDTKLDNYIARVRANHEADDEDEGCQSPPLTDRRSSHGMSAFQMSGGGWKGSNSSIPDFTEDELKQGLKRLAETQEQNHQ